MPKPEPIQPLSPFEVMEYAPSHRAEWVASLVTFINERLKACLATLVVQGEIEIGDSSVEWAAYHAEVVELFRQKQWIVTAGYVPMTYIFKLPGTMINGK